MSVLFSGDVYFNVLLAFICDCGGGGGLHTFQQKEALLHLPLGPLLLYQHPAAKLY
jgi:hypothetical protein